ncbi:putative S-adenosyl-L-methionine-dependent methyltransferase [Seiridium cardinale]
MNPYNSTKAREGGKSLHGLGAKSVVHQQHDTKTPGAEHSGNRSSSLSRDNVPLLPSQLLESYKVAPAPSHLFTERVPVAIKSEPEPAADEFWFQEAPGQRDLLFSTVSNEMINKSLGRQPGGTSVVEPDSILGESGRLYHGYKDGKYLLPNDAAEQDRLDLQHAIWRLVLDGWLALAPLTTPPKFVLDIGTGTGIWVNEFVTDVVHRHVWTPVSPWAEDRKFRNIGAWSQSKLYDGAKGIGWRLLKASGMGPEQIEQLIVEVRQELRLRESHVYGLCHVVYGRKPLSGRVI